MGPAPARRLAAIVIADVVGFSRHMERDDAGTLARLRETWEQLIDPKIAEYGGHLVKTAGDGMLIEFSSADAALRFAVDMQRMMTTRNHSEPTDERIEYRIGINLSDIIVDGVDIAGDGVNVASRLEALAQPGGICVSGAVREQIHGSLDVGFDDIGDQKVKNIVRPIRVYQVLLGTGSGERRGAAAHWRVNRVLDFRRKVFWIAASAAIITGAIAALLLNSWSDLRTIVSTAIARAPGTPPALSIAILPFAVAKGTSANEQIGDSMTQDLTNAIERTSRSAWVVSNGLARSYEGKSVDARVAGRALNVRYLGEGEIRRFDSTLRINTRLIDAGSATQIWSDRFDMSDSGQSAEYDAAVAQLAKRLRVALFDAEAARVARQAGSNATAIELVLRGSTIDDGSLKGALEARKLYDEALRLDPHQVWALVASANTNSAELIQNPHADHDRLVQEMDNLSLRAIASDRSDARAWSIRGDALMLAWRWDAALDAFGEVLRLDPQRTAAYQMRGWMLTSMGRAEEAFAQFDKAIEVDPREADDGSLLFARCRAHLYLGHYDKAINDCERASARQSLLGIYSHLTAAYAQRGDMVRSAAAKAQLLKISPQISIAQIKSYRLSDNPVYLQQIETQYLTGLRKAGIPEQ